MNKKEINPHASLLQSEVPLPELHDRESGPVLLFRIPDQPPRELRLDMATDPRYFRKLRGKNELLAKAVGYKSNPPPRVWDLSLGLAEDAWTLARIGCPVHGFERVDLLFQLVKASFEKMRHELTAMSPLHAAAMRLSMSAGDATTILHELQKGNDPSGYGYPDVLYFDPMYAGVAKSSALPRLEMQLLRAWLGEDTDQKQVLALALQIPGMRVVVKRPARSVALCQPVTHAFYGEKVRYDMYQNTEVHGD